MRIIKDNNGYYYENDLGQAQTDFVGNVIYYKYIPWDSFMYNIIDKTKNHSPFRNPFKFNPLEGPKL